MSDELDLGYLCAVAGTAVWTPRPLVAMLVALGSARAVVEFARDPRACPPLSCECVGKDVLARLALVDDRAARAALDEARREGQGVVTSTDATYPARLHDLCDPPPVLYYRGALAALERPAIAIVGSRAATPYGRSMAKSIVHGMAAYG